MEALSFSTESRDEVSNTLIQRIRSYSNVGGKFGMVVQGEDCFRLLDSKIIKRSILSWMSDIPSSLRGLDVTILREIILGPCIGTGQGECRRSDRIYAVGERGSEQGP